MTEVKKNKKPWTLALNTYLCFSQNFCDKIFKDILVTGRIQVRDWFEPGVQCSAFIKEILEIWVNVSDLHALSDGMLHFPDDGSIVVISFHRLHYHGSEW